MNNEKSKKIFFKNKFYYGLRCPNEHTKPVFKIFFDKISLTFMKHAVFII